MIYYICSDTIISDGHKFSVTCTHAFFLRPPNPVLHRKGKYMLVFVLQITAVYILKNIRSFPAAPGSLGSYVAGEGIEPSPNC